ncbi:hypothetical protein V9T40_003654 [Parthenolecanium corni]|uniref:Uncharacterized protein n=1 Tax=Parthenolecanium corni TaxID=536013 RepID=A0AAN9TVR6_9HEMI
MAAKEDTSGALALLEASVPQLPDLKGKPGSATIKASEEDSREVETHRTVTKNEGDKKLEQESHKLQKQDSERTAQASIKTTNEGGVTRTIATTQVTFSSSFEEEETTHQKITSAPVKSIVHKK